MDGLLSHCASDIEHQLPRVVGRRRSASPVPVGRPRPRQKEGEGAEGSSLAIRGARGYVPGSRGGGAHDTFVVGRMTIYCKGSRQR